MTLRVLLLCLLMLVPIAPAAQTGSSATPIEFRDPGEERRFRALTNELRCVMCQNQSLADSNALIAQDLRLEVLRLMRDGRSDTQIKRHLVERYSEFVLYKPQLTPGTWLLWFGPALLLLGGGVALVRIVRRHGGGTPTSNASDNQEW